MQNSLKSIIREAFNTAYKQYKSNLVNEDTSAEMAAKFDQTPEGQAQKAKADQVIDILDSQKRGWENYRWDPSGTSSYDNLNHAQWNYIIETLSEKARATKDEKYAKIFSNIYSVLPIRTTDSDGNSVSSNSPAYNYLINNSEMLRDIARQNPDIAYDAIENAWARAFYTEDWNKLLDLYQSMPGANFGSLLMNNIRRWTNDLLKSKKVKNARGTSSLDAPSNITGKSTDVEDIGGGELEGSEDDSIQGNKPGGFEDEENSEDNTESGLDAFSADANDIDFVSKRQKDAFLKFAKFQKTMEKVVNYSKSLNLTKKQNSAIFALQQIVQNFKSFPEIAQEFPDLFSVEGGDSNLEVAAVNSRLKSILNKVAKPMLEPYGVTPDIFSDPNWKTKHQNLPADIVDQIINQFNTTSKAGTSEKRQYTHAFKLFADEHKKPEEIASTPAQGIYKKERLSNKALVDEIEKHVKNLEFNEKFERVFDSIMNENGLPIQFDKIDWREYILAGKEFQGLKPKKVADIDSKTKEKNTYFFQNEEFSEFLKENYDAIITMVYKRLSKEL